MGILTPILKFNMMNPKKKKKRIDQAVKISKIVLKFLNKKKKKRKQRVLTPWDPGFWKKK